MTKAEGRTFGWQVPPEHTARSIAGRTAIERSVQLPFGQNISPFQDFLRMHNVPLFCPFWKICTGLRAVGARFPLVTLHFHRFFTFSSRKIRPQNLWAALVSTRIEHFRHSSTNKVLEWQETFSLSVKFFHPSSPCRVQIFENCRKAVHYSSGNSAHGIN